MFYRRLLCITYRIHKTNKYVQEIILNQIGKYEPLLGTIKRRMLKYFGHICRYENLAKTILHGKIEGTYQTLVKIGRGRPVNNWMININKWTQKPTCELLRQVDNREGWRRFVLKASEMISLTILESW